MKTREEMKELLRKAIGDLKAFADEFEDLLIGDLKAFADKFEDLSDEMDGLTDEEFDERSSAIQDKYSKKGIELF